VVGWAAAAAATRWGGVRRSDQEAQTSAGRCRPGDILGLAEDDVVLIGTRPDAVAATLLDKMLASSGELVTLVGGALADGVRRHLADAHPTVEVQAHLSSGPGLLIGVE
jgi:dihydroxyacetone kinase-like predicted kinase